MTLLFPSLLNSLTLLSLSSIKRLTTRNKNLFRPWQAFLPGLKPILSLVVEMLPLKAPGGSWKADNPVFYCGVRNQLRRG